MVLPNKYTLLSPFPFAKALFPRFPFLQIFFITASLVNAVSYTQLDVYKRQQQACGAGRQGDGPLFRACLGLAGNHPAALLDMERPVEGKGAVGFIKVAPHETAEFAPPQAGDQLRVEEIMSDFIRLTCIHELF